MLGRSISELCFSGTQEELNLTENGPSRAALRQMWRRWDGAVLPMGLKADITAGFSLVICGAGLCGVLPFEEAIRLIQIRANAMQAAVPVGQGGMIAVMGKNCGRGRCPLR